MHKDTSKEHKHTAPKSLGFGIITMSETRTLETDGAGDEIDLLAKKEGHFVTERFIVKDNVEKIIDALNELLSDDNTDIIICNGGTGIAPKDVTIEAVRPLFEKEIASFNPLFASLSYNAVGSVALVSRATAGIIKGKAIFCIPGSPRACKLAMEKLILPEAGHITKHLGD